MKRPPQSAGAISVRTPAKINLHLKVCGRRHDGFHSLTTVFHTLGIWDELRISPAGKFKFTAQGLPVPGGEDNLCVRAYRLLRAEGGLKCAARIHLVKNIPSGAGLGGGSSDAAACLVGLARFFNLTLGRKYMLKLAARLGSDVPFFLSGKAALGRGRGDRLTATKSRIRAWAVVLKPRYSISTKLAYRSLDRLRRRRVPPAGSLNRVRRALARGSLAGLEIVNDFTETVNDLRPRNRVLLAGLAKAGLKPAFLAGSGSAVVGIGKSRRHAAGAARKLARSFKVAGYLARLAPYEMVIKRA